MRRVLERTKVGARIESLQSGAVLSNCGDSQIRAISCASVPKVRMSIAALRLEFVSDDSRWIWPINRRQLAVVTGEPPRNYRRHRQQCDQYRDRGQMSPGIDAAWNDLKLPASDQSDWLWTGSNDKGNWVQFAAVVQPANFIDLSGNRQSPTANTPAADSENSSFVSVASLPADLTGPIRGNSARQAGIVSQWSAAQVHRFGLESGHAQGIGISDAQRG